MSLIRNNRLKGYSGIVKRISNHAMSCSYYSEGDMNKHWNIKSLIYISLLLLVFYCHRFMSLCCQSDASCYLIKNCCLISKSAISLRILGCHLAANTFSSPPFLPPVDNHKPISFERFSFHQTWTNILSDTALIWW